jgi:type IX secretion system PorP/SprF family membrane protein
MRLPRVFILLLVAACANGQQTISYIQFTFNKAGMNPAASGTAPHQKYYFAFGAGRQWIAFDNAPRQNFVNVSYTIRRPRSYSMWQNVGIYVDTDDAGLLGNSGAYGTYAIHFLLRRKLILSYGVFAGIRRYERSTAFFDVNDPVVAKSGVGALAYPDIIPGFRITSDVFFFDASVRNLTINRQKDYFSGNGIGGPSILFPTLYTAYGVRRPITDLFLVLPSAALTLPLPGVPLVDLNLMFYYANRVGAGVALRNLGSASAILQVRLLQDITAGFAYSYPLNNLRHAAPMSYEIMIGVVPYGMDTKPVGAHSVARCPTLHH